MRRKDKLIGYCYFILIVGMIFLTCSSNNNSTPFIGRFFNLVRLPLWSNGKQGLYFPTIFLLIIIFIASKGVYIHWKEVYPKISKVIVLVVIVLFMIIPQIFNGLERVYKSYEGGLKGIYCYKEESRIGYYKNSEDNFANIECYLTLENLGEKEIEFDVLLQKFSKISEDTSIMKYDGKGVERVSLMPREKNHFKLNFKGIALEGLQNCSGGINDFNFTIRDDKKIVEFYLNDVLE